MLKLYRSYMDETGIQRGDRVCTVAGYVATVEAWGELERRWRFVLDAFHIEYFHALEFYGKDAKYKGWNRGKRAAFINALFECLAECDLRPVSSAIDCDLFWSLTEDERHYVTGGIHDGMRWRRSGAPSKPYFVPFHGCIIQACDVVPDGGMLYPVMSRQDQYKMKALELYDRILNEYPPPNMRPKLAGDMVFSDSKKVPGLQAADLGTYWVGQFMKYVQAGRHEDTFSHLHEVRRVLKRLRNPKDLNFFNVQVCMALLCSANRHIKTSFPTRDQFLPSLPVVARREVLGTMRKASLRQFSDLWRSNYPEDHG